MQGRVLRLKPRRAIIVLGFILAGLLTGSGFVFLAFGGLAIGAWFFLKDDQNPIGLKIDAMFTSSKGAE